MAKILIVEDEKHLNEAYQIVIEKEGHEALIAYNGREALEIAKAQKPDLILLDLRMPKMSGTEFLKELDPKKTLPKTKIVIFSNYDNSNEISEAYSLGADKYILKAWSSPSELVKLVRETLAAKAAS